MTDANSVHGPNGPAICDNKIVREWLSTEGAAYFLSVSPNALRITPLSQRAGEAKPTGLQFQEVRA